MKPVLAAAAACALLAGPAAHAQTPVESLSRCLADSTTGKDRKDLARWVFFAMAAHPEMKPFAAPTVAGATDDADRGTANLFTRLVAESCLKQTQTAFQQGGPVAIQAAFQTLGQLAMQELMSDGQVNASMSAFQKYLDQEKIGRALAGK